MTLTFVVSPGGIKKVCPGGSGNVVAVSTESAIPTILMNRFSELPMPWSIFVDGLVMNPPNTGPYAAITGTPPVTTTLLVAGLRRT